MKRPVYKIAPTIFSSVLYHEGKGVGYGMRFADTLKLNFP
jgi:hypothetical protein